MSPALKFAILALFTYRVSALLTQDAGPFDVFQIVRLRLGRQAARTGFAGRLGRTLADLFNCPLCMSVWVAFPLAFMAFVNQPYAVRLVYWGALSGAANVLNILCEGRQS